MPTLRSQAAGSALGNVGRSSKSFKQEDPAVELASHSPACLGPCTPAQDHEAARAGLATGAPMIRRSRRLGVMAAVEVVDPLGLPSRKASKREVLRRGADASVSAEESPKGKRKAEEHLEETFRDISSIKTSLAGRAKLEKSSLVSLGKPDSSSQSSPAFVRRACDRDGVASVSKRKNRGRRTPGFEAMLLGGASPDDRSTGPFSFDLNERPNTSSNSGEVQEVPNIETPSSAEQFSLRLNFEDSPIHGDVTMMHGLHEEQLAAHEVAIQEFFNVERPSNTAGQFCVRLNLEDPPNNAMLDEDHEEQALLHEMIENSDNYAPASQADAVEGPSERLQAEVGEPRRGARGRGRRGGGARASRSRILQIARDRAFHLAHFNADGDEAPAGAPPHQNANGRRRGRPPRQLNQNRPQEFFNVERPSNTAGQFNLEDPPNDAMLDEDHEEQAPPHEMIENSDNYAPASQVDAVEGPSERLQAEVGEPRRGARGRGRRGGGAGASRSSVLQIARDRAFHFAHFNADGDEAPAGAPPPQNANGRRRGRPPRQLNQNRPQEFFNVERPSNTAGQFCVRLNLEDPPNDAMLDEDHEEQAPPHEMIENSDNYAPASQTDAVEGPSERLQAEVGEPRRGARGRGRRGGGAGASRSRFLQIARDRAFHFAHFNADWDEAPAGPPPPQNANGRRRGRPPRQLNQNRPQEFFNVERPSNTAGQFCVRLNLEDPPNDAMADEDHEEQAPPHEMIENSDNMPDEDHAEQAPLHEMIENSDNYAPASQADAVEGPSERLQAEVGEPRRGARGRGRRGGGAEASRSRFLQIARDRAFHFAHFNADGDEAPAGAPPPQNANGRRRGRPPRQLNQNRPQAPPQVAQVDWPGPFSTARQLVNNRAEAAAARQNTSAPGTKLSSVDWQPTRVQGDSALLARKCPSLEDLCYSVLSHNAEYIVSLEGVPEVFKSRISKALCERRKMSAKLVSLFFQGEVSDLHVLDCTQVSEDELTIMMKEISTSRLEKLHLDHCGRALSEQCLLSTIASPSTVTLLKSISLKGAYRLNDRGLEALLQASPQLVHLDLRTCSFLTNASVKAISCCVGDTLESLVLDGCPNLNAAQIVHDLTKLQKLQKISLAEISGITDEIVSELCVQLGSHLKELVLTGCTALTDAAVAAIGPCCPSLQVLDLAHLSLLSDVAIAHITDNLRQIQVLNVKRCKFSDEALAAFITASGAALRTLSLNCVQQVADHTIVALAKHSHACLECLDLSFCRLVGDECLGFLADTCLQLQELRLYGCTQVTDKFLKGHSNLNLQVVGLASSV